MTVTGSAKLDAVIYAKFRAALPEYNVAVLHNSPETAHRFRQLLKDISTPYFKMFIKNPTATVVQTVDAHQGHTSDNCMLTQLACFIIIEIARRKEIPNYRKDIPNYVRTG